jgi:hypothetical protein
MTKSKVYDNCEIYTQDTKFFIGYCPKKRMDWYLTKGLAIKLTDNSIAITFEPRMKNGDSFEEMTLKRENNCVVCGNDDNLKKFHTIPQEFKKKFPLKYKSHVSNDIVLLCDEHIDEANIISKSFREDLFDAYNITDNHFINGHKKKIINEAQQILNGKENMDLLKKLMKIDEEPSIEEINELAKSEYINIINGCKSASEYIVKKYIDKNKLDVFITMWKENFIQNMQPNFLPKCYLKNQLGK